MIRFASLVVSAAILSGCVSINKQQMDAKSASALKDQPVTQTARKKPDFAAMTAGKAAFAMLGALAMISEGNKLIEEHKVEDPANTIAAGLIKSMEASHAIRPSGTPVAVTADDVAHIAGAANGGSRYVMDVQTINWSFGYFPTDWTHYRVIYTAKARLIDTSSKAVIAEGFCKRIPETNVGAPTYDELLASGAARLKKELSTAAEECVNSLKKEMLAT